MKMKTKTKSKYGEKKMNVPEIKTNTVVLSMPLTFQQAKIAQFKRKNVERKTLVELFEKLDHGCPEVLELMDKTYATQRKSINDVTRDISLVMTEWPFLTNVEYIVEHADKLLGKFILTTWNKSLENKMQPIRKYLKT